MQIRLLLSVQLYQLNELNFEEFISIKGIKAIGNQLTTDKIKIINLLESLPYELPEEEVKEIVLDEIDANNLGLDDDGQIILFPEAENPTE